MDELEGGIGVGWGVWNEEGDGLMVAGREGVKTNRKHSEKGEFTKVPGCVRIQPALDGGAHPPACTHRPARPSGVFHSFFYIIQEFFSSLDFLC